MHVHQRLPTFLIRLIPHFIIRYYQQVINLFRGETSFSKKSMHSDPGRDLFFLLRARRHKSIALMLLLLVEVMPKFRLSYWDSYDVTTCHRRTSCSAESSGTLCGAHWFPVGVLHRGYKDSLCMCSFVEVTPCSTSSGRMICFRRGQNVQGAP